jgi:hypothetical protein
MSIRKSIDSLQIEDLERYPVWSLVGSDESGAIMVRPISNLPVSDLKNKFVGLKVRLGNNTQVWALIGNIHVLDPYLNQHFLTIAIFKEGKWFNLARYHDVDYEKRGPARLADFLGLSTNEVFPISYDVSKYSRGIDRALSGEIPMEPKEVLTMEELYSLAIKSYRAS